MDKGRKKKTIQFIEINSDTTPTNNICQGVLKLINLDVKQRLIPITVFSVTILKSQVFIKAAGQSCLIFNLYYI